MVVAGAFVFDKENCRVTRTYMHKSRILAAFFVLTIYVLRKDGYQLDHNFMYFRLSHT
jgi:hypothetical protein